MELLCFIFTVAAFGLALILISTAAQLSTTQRTQRQLFHLLANCHCTKQPLPPPPPHPVKGLLWRLRGSPTNPE